MINSVSELRQSLKGVNGKDTIRVAIPTDKGVAHLCIQRIEYNRAWGEWRIIPNSL